VNLLQRPIPAPGAVVMVDRRPRAKVLGQQPPLATRPAEVHQPVDDLPHIGRGPAPFGGAGLAWRKVSLDQFPLFVREIRRVYHFIHTGHYRQDGRFSYTF